MKQVVAITAMLLISTGLTFGETELTLKNYPRVDGSTSTQSLQALVKSTILKADHAVTHSDTGKAYTNLIEGKVDLILVARAPSTEEFTAVNRKNVSLKASPVALDALVFLVHKDNGIEGLSLDQIRSIYTGKTAYWEQSGVSGAPTGRISAYTRDRFSGSEELMRTLVMNNVHMVEASSEHPFFDDRLRVGGMGRSIENASDQKLGLAYSVFFYVKHLDRLFEVKQKALEALRRKNASRLQSLEESDLRQKDPQYWADLRKREQEALATEYSKSKSAIEDVRKGLQGRPNLKMIKIDGIEPTTETIASRQYPVTANVYVVVRDSDKPGCPAFILRDWLLSPAGQQVVAQSGYAPFTPGTAASGVQGITADNVAESTGKDQWRWTVFLKGSRQEIDGIKCVEYTLHSTFPDPVRRVCDQGDPSRPFALSATGWGAFEVGINVFMKDGRKLDLKHDLKF